MDVVRPLLTPAYLPMVISAIVMAITFLHLLLSARAASPTQFQVIRVAWSAIVFLGGMLAIALLLDSRFLASESGDGRIAFISLSFWFGIVCSTYAAFGIFAWTLPSRWSRIIELREQRRREKSIAGGRF